MAPLNASRERVVVTGVSSFVGYRIAKRLSERGYAVTGTVHRPLRRSQEVNHQRIASARMSGVAVKRLDLTDVIQLVRFIAAERPCVWVHHAGMSANWDRPDYDLNEGHRIHTAPLSILYEALKLHGCQGVIITGSGEEYSTLPSLCFEEDSCWPLTPYGLSKLTATMRSFQLAQQFELPTRVARLFVPYGPLDTAENVIPSVIRALAAGKGIDLSPCLEQRDFLHVDDIADGYVRLLSELRNHDSLFDVFNLSGGEGVSYRKLLIRIAQLLHADMELLRFGRIPARPDETPYQAGSNDKARGVLQWKPRPLEAGLVSYLQDEGYL